jgi:hypothetical protein
MAGTLYAWETKSKPKCALGVDKPWYNDREMWPAYLSVLAAQRFNRFNLTLGIGYDFLRNVTDGYFLFGYPFLLSVPGYNVRVPQLPDAERDRNLEMLRFISEQTVARGLEFQLGNCSVSMVTLTGAPLRTGEGANEAIPISRPKSARNC